MGANFEDKPRQVIPRWRPFAETVVFGETASADARVKPQPNGVQGLLAWKRAAWEEKKDVAHASDLIATAAVAGEMSEATEAMQFVRERGSRVPLGLRDVTARLMGGAVPVETEAHSGLPTQTDVREAISRARRSLTDYHRNAVIWVELARLRILQGNREAASKAMSVALSLAPDNRFVLRSAARLYVHLDEPDRAHDFLRRHPRALSDPWLLAAEVAVADAASRQSRHIKRGRAMILAGAFRPFAIAELAGAIGTEEARAGNRRQARKFFGHALEDPTENVVAQAVWVARNTRLIEVREDSLATPHSHEAKAWTYLSARRWAEALGEAKIWFTDQPFSTRPATMATYVASVPLGRHREAIEIARAALQANPTDTVLLNNLAFSLASIEEIGEAQETFSRIRSQEATAHLRVMLTATQGLLAYRSGEATLGRGLYENAIKLALEGGAIQQAALAAAYLAREELRINSNGAREVIEAAGALASKSGSDEAQIILRAIQ